MNSDATIHSGHMRHPPTWVLMGSRRVKGKGSPCPRFRAPLVQLWAALDYGAIITMV